MYCNKKYAGSGHGGLEAVNVICFGFSEILFMNFSGISVHTASVNKILVKS